MVSRVKDLFEAEAGSFGDTMMAHNGVAGYKVPEYQRQYNWETGAPETSARQTA